MSFNGNLQPGTDAGEDLTTKGDVHGYSTENTRVPVGTDGHVLTARASDSYGIAWEAAGGGDTDPNKVVMPTSSTIGDYSTPDAATASSSATVAPTYSFDFSSSTGWTLESGYTISGNEFNFNKSSNDNTRAYYDLGSALSDTAWTMRFKINWSSMSLPTNLSNYLMYYGVRSSNAVGTTANDGIMMVSNTADQDNTWYMQALSKYNQSQQAGTYTGRYPAGSYSTSTDYYIQLRRLSSTEFDFKVYSDSSYTTELFDSGTTSVNSSSTGYQYVWIGVDNYGSNGAAWTGIIDDLQIWDGSTSAGSPPQNVIDDDVTSYWESTSETNPNIYVDCTGASSDTSLTQLAYYANSNTTETEIKIQYATNAGGVSSWNDLRTITVSDLTNGQYNYIRFNNATGRYVRVYGNSGLAKVLAINELKVQEPSDSLVGNTHGHLGISNSDTSLNLDGT